MISEAGIGTGDLEASEDLSCTTLHADRACATQAQNAAPDLSQLPDPSELFGKAKGAADDVSGKAKGATDQATGSAKGAAEQAKGSASGAASKVCTPATLCGQDSKLG